mmetsp:Transcript_15659/g.39032  ORF Transcript_15659/g.39032 Transcript_15659/m.39032 type:complete len:208 (-) Transcript_15659:772-1395(-)
MRARDRRSAWRTGSGARVTQQRATTSTAVASDTRWPTDTYSGRLLPAPHTAAPHTAPLAPTSGSARLPPAPDRAAASSAPISAPPPAARAAASTLSASCGTGSGGAGTAAPSWQLTLGCCSCPVSAKRTAAASTASFLRPSTTSRFLATPMVGMPAATPRCDAAPQRAGCSTPHPSTSSSCGIHLPPSVRAHRASSAAYAGTSLKAR